MEELMMLLGLIISQFACSLLSQSSDNAFTTIGSQDWHGWMIIDKPNHRVAFLSSQDGRTTAGGVIVDGMQLRDGAYVFAMPYSSNFETIFVPGDEGGMVYGSMGVDDSCTLSVNAQGLLGSGQFEDLSGPLYRLVIESGTQLLASGKCLIE